MIAVKIYDYNKSFPPLFKAWQALGIDTAFVSVTLASNQAFRALAQQYGLSIFIIAPVFYNRTRLKTQPDLFAKTQQGQPALEDWVHFVCPSRPDYRQEKIETLKSWVRDLKPTGLSLDFIRHFVFWEMVYPDSRLDELPHCCFCPHCTQLFEQIIALKIPTALTTIAERASWILENQAAAWITWKCSLITSMVSDIVYAVRQLNPALLINLHAVPWRSDDFEGAIKKIAGQDFAQLAPHLDYLSPMCYSYMLKREPAWISSLVADLQRQAEGKIIPSIQVKEHYRQGPFEVDSFEQCLVEALKAPSNGVIFWSWDAIEQDPQRQSIIKNLVTKFNNP